MRCALLKMSVTMLALFSVSCSTLTSSLKSAREDGDETAAIAGPATVETELTGDGEKEERETAEEPSISDTSVPLEVNAHVEKWIRYFQGRGRPQMTLYLERSARYIPMMQQILAQYGLPKELVYIALIESGFSSRAYSRAAAVGYWQFMRGTAKGYGLRVDAQVDERRDPILSTHAAAKYLKGLYHLFGSWYLAIASYNVGENKMKYVVMKHYTRDFWELVEKKILPAETLNYVPKFNAARLIAENPEKYGFRDLSYEPAFRFEQIAVHRPISLSALARESDLSLAELKRLNPAFKTDYIPVVNGRSINLRVPEGRMRAAMGVLWKAYASRTLPTRLPGKSGVSAEAKRPPVAHKYVYYKVKSGDNLIQIARRFETSVATLQSLNGLQRKSVLKLGAVLKVPAHSVPSRSHAAAGASNMKYHKVMRGDTLLGIANRYGVSLSALMQANRLQPRSHLLAGATLKIP